MPPLPFRSGLTALITVMVLGSVALLTAITIALRGSGEVDLGLSTLHGQQADVILSGCVDDALIRLSRDATFAHDEAVVTEIGQGTCTIKVFDIPGASFQTYAVAARAERGRSQKCAYVQVIVPVMQVAQWKQVSCSLLEFE